MYESRGEQGIMGKDYKDIQMDRQLRKDGSLASRRRESVTGYDFGVNYQVPTGGLSYAQLNVDSRAYTAIVTLKKKQGSFDNIKDAVEFTNRQGGGRILIMPGTYTIDYDIPLYDDISIEGLSEKDVILDFNSSGSYSIKLDGVDTDDRINNVEIRKMTIKNNHNTTTGTIYLDWVDNVLIEDITFTDNRTGSSGFDIIGTSQTLGVHRLSINRCTASGGATFLQIQSGHGNVMRDCDISGYNNKVLKGIETETGLRMSIDNNQFIDNSAGVIHGYLYYSKVSNNRMTGDVTSGSMIEITETYGNSWIGNFISSDNNSGTLLDFDNCSNNYFSGNALIQAGTGYVVQLGKSNNTVDFTFTGNQISTPSGAGDNTAIKITTAERTVIVGNIINGKIYGVDIDAGVDKTVVIGNSMSGGTGIINDNGDKTLYQTATDGDPLNTT